MFFVFCRTRKGPGIFAQNYFVHSLLKKVLYFGRKCDIILLEFIKNSVLKNTSDKIRGNGVLK